MPVNITVIHPKDFISTKVDGTLDLSASREVLLKLVSMIKTPREFDILIDTRQARVSLSITDLYEIGAAVASHPAVALCRTALLTSLDEEGRAAFFELVAQNRGASLSAFTSFEEAIAWLIMSGQRQ
ncbi:MAG TPA: hypothetical protein VMU02_09645 [bacterium]|nr:hypothetical protein [bacterium]